MLYFSLELGVSEFFEIILPSYDSFFYVTGGKFNIFTAKLIFDGGMKNTTFFLYIENFSTRSGKCYEKGEALEFQWNSILEWVWKVCTI